MIYDQAQCSPAVRYAIWAPAVFYRNTSVEPRGAGPSQRWSADINDARIYDSMFSVIGALVRGEADNMYGVEIRRLRPIPIPPRPAYVDEGRVE